MLREDIEEDQPFLTGMYVYIFFIYMHIILYIYMYIPCTRSPNFGRTVGFDPDSLGVEAEDVSNPLKPFELSRAWAHRVLDEFFLQGAPRLRGVRGLCPGDFLWSASFFRGLRSMAPCFVSGWFFITGFLIRILRSRGPCSGSIESMCFWGLSPRPSPQVPK